MNISYPTPKLNLISPDFTKGLHISYNRFESVIISLDSLVI